MPNDSEQLDGLFREVASSVFWNSVGEHHAQEEFHLKRAVFFHEPMQLKDDLKVFPYVRRRPGRKYCDLPIEEAEPLAVQEEREAACHREHINALQKKYDLLWSLLRRDALSNVYKLPEWEEIITKQPEVAARTIDLQYCKWLERVQSHSGRIDRACRLQVILDHTASQVIYDDISYPVSYQMAQFFQAILTAEGESVSMTSHGLHSRKIETLPVTLRGLIERKPGRACRIPREKLWRN